jgi:hypothetical protein
MINKLSIDDIYGQEYNDVNYELKNKKFSTKNFQQIFPVTV